jgi:hypothetical protein
MITADQLRELFANMKITHSGPDVATYVDPETGEEIRTGHLAVEGEVGGEVFGLSLSCSTEVARAPDLHVDYMANLWKMAEMSLRHNIAESLGLTKKAEDLGP